MELGLIKLIYTMKKTLLFMMLLLFVVAGCKNKNAEEASENSPKKFEYVVDRFADVEIMRYQLDHWDSLSLNQKKLIYYLSEATLAGRDITFDQNCVYNILVKNTLEAIVETYSGDRESEDWKKFMDYTKRFWFSNGIHHHYSDLKFYPEISKEYFLSLLNNSDKSLIFKGDNMQLQMVTDLVSKVIFDPSIAPVKICKENGKDLVANSAVNFYRHLTQAEVEAFYADYRKTNKKLIDPERPISIGLNSQLVKDEELHTIFEYVYKIGGLYSDPINKIVYWLQKAASVAENDAQKNHILKLIEFYQTGDLKTWDDFNVLWVQDVASQVDYVNGFIEVYDDPLGQKASWEALVNYKDNEHSQRSDKLCQNAQWFEDNAPVKPQYKKEKVTGIAAKVITVAQLGGANYPSTPIGINLPNSNWIRKDYGSKSVTMENIVYAYDQARLKSGVPDEFYFSENEIELAKKYGYIADNLHTDLHECIGHASGKMMPGIDDAALKNYHSVIEESRADLYALYFLADPKMVELGLLPNEDAYKAGYYNQMLNGLMLQLNRIDLGGEISQSHMRNRALIANWCFEKGQQDNVMEFVVRDGKRYLKINDYEKLRQLFGELLGIIQDIKSTGNYSAAMNLVETYGTKIDPKIHKEVKDRYARLDVAPYGGFVNPKFVPVENNGEITDIKVDYSESYVEQMMRYAKQNSFLKK